MGLDLVTPTFLKRLEALRVRAQRHFTGLNKGERRSPRSGSSIEFLDYRDYNYGDDLRYIDWNVYGRLEKLFLKLYVDDEDLRIDILIDCSRSMGFGSPSKLDYGKQMAAAIAYIGLMNHDRVRIIPFSDTAAIAAKTYTGRAQIMPVLQFISQLALQADTHLNETLQALTATTTKPGVILLLSDLLDSDGYEDGLKYLRCQGFDINVIHILSPEETDPELIGDLLLIDSENESQVEYSVSPRALAQYKATLADFLAGAQKFCARHSMRYVFTTTDTPLEEVVLRRMRAKNVLE